MYITTRETRRFWSYVDKRDGKCWLWQGTIGTYGYGVIVIDGHSQRAHRVAWELTNGPIPDKHMVLHTCDVRMCVNPAHLYVGTGQDNANDAKTRGKRLFGLSRHQKAITAEQVAELRERAQRGEKAPDLAIAYGIARSTAINIIRGRRR